MFSETFKNGYVHVRNVLSYIFNITVESPEYRTKVRKYTLTGAAVTVAISLLVTIIGSIGDGVSTAVWFTTALLALFVIHRSWQVYTSGIDAPELPESKHGEYGLILLATIIVSWLVGLIGSFIFANLFVGAVFLAVSYGLRYMYLEKEHIAKLDADIAAKYGSYADISSEPFIAKDSLDVIVKTVFIPSDDAKKMVLFTLTASAFIAVLTAIVYGFFAVLGANETVLSWVLAFSFWFMGLTVTHQIADKYDRSGGVFVLAYLFTIVSAIVGAVVATQSDIGIFAFGAFALIIPFIYSTFHIAYNFSDRFEAAMKEMEKVNKAKVSIPPAVTIDLSNQETVKTIEVLIQGAEHDKKLAIEDAKWRIANAIAPKWAEDNKLAYIQCCIDLGEKPTKASFSAWSANTVEANTEM